MSLDLAKLERVTPKGGGRYRARCPACAETGGDAHGEDHLLIQADGRFGCCACPGDKDHRRRIYQLAGDRSGCGKNRKPTPSGLLHARVTPLPQSAPASPVSIMADLAVYLGSDASDAKKQLPTQSPSPVSDTSDAFFQPTRIRARAHPGMSSKSVSEASERPESEPAWDLPIDGEQHQVWPD